MKKHKFCLKFTTGLPSAKIRDFGTSFVPKSVRHLLRTCRELVENLERTCWGREITKIIEILTLREQLWSWSVANNFDLESVLKIVQILTLRKIFGTFAVVKIHTLREHIWRYQIKFSKIAQILTLHERFAIFNNSSVFQSMKSTPYAGFF